MKLLQSKKGQLVQMFEIIGTVMVVFILFSIAMAYGSGESFYKKHIAKDLALMADAMYINPGEEISTDYVVNADKFGYKISFAGNNENANFVSVQGGRVFGDYYTMHLDQMISESHPFVSKNNQPFTKENGELVFESPHMLSIRHSGSLEVAEKQAE